MKIIKYRLMDEVRHTYQVPITEEVEKPVERDDKFKGFLGAALGRVTETVKETVVVGYEEKEEVEQTFVDKTIFSSEADFEMNYAIAEKEAYNGEITVEDAPDPETPATNEATFDEMAEAIKEGVNEV